LENDLNTKGHT
jgi:hypothetical protein